eukprot:m.287050 g.287050  ORF g.287050 m.287050 type:complete len:104 (-) comp15787_c0_seq1:2896-3207(-)
MCQRKLSIFVISCEHLTNILILLQSLAQKHSKQSTQPNLRGMNAWWRAVAKIAPVSFTVGAGIEWFMLRVQIGDETFYDTVTRLEAQKRIDAANEEEARAGQD